MGSRRPLRSVGTQITELTATQSAQLKRSQVHARQRTARTRQCAERDWRDKGRDRQDAVADWQDKQMDPAS